MKVVKHWWHRLPREGIPGNSQGRVPQGLEEHDLVEDVPVKSTG